MSSPASGDAHRAGALQPDTSGFKSHLCWRLTRLGPGDGEILSFPGCYGGGVVRARALSAAYPPGCCDFQVCRKTPGTEV